MKKTLLIILSCMLAGCSNQKQETSSARTGTIICVGDSITYGAGVSETLDTETWPAQLQTLLGSDYNVINLGVNGRTLMKEGDYPYTENPAYQTSLTSNADIVLIMLGTNDSKYNNWNAENYETELCEFVETYQALDSKPEVYLLTCPDVILVDGQDYANYNIDRDVVENELQTLIKQAAETTGAGLIDIYPLTKDHAEYYSIDGIHTNAEGNRVIAEAVAETLNQRNG